MQVPPRSAAFAPAVKVMSHGGHSEGAIVVFGTDFKDRMTGTDNAECKRIKLDPMCLVEAGYNQRTHSDQPQRIYNLPDQEYTLGFSLDAVPGGNGSAVECCAISVQTHGFIDVAVNRRLTFGHEVALTDLLQSRVDEKVVQTPANQPIPVPLGTVVTPLDNLPGDPANTYRIRMRLDIGRFNATGDIAEAATAQPREDEARGEITSGVEDLISSSKTSQLLQPDAAGVYNV